jgi:hypothetical protein
MEMKHSIKGVLDIELKLLISIIQYFPCWRERVAMIVFYFLYLLSLRQITTTVFYFLLLGILRQQKKYCSYLSLLSHAAVSLKRRSISRFISLKLVSLKLVHCCVSMRNTVAFGYNVYHVNFNLNRLQHSKFQRNHFLQPILHYYKLGIKP